MCVIVSTKVIIKNKVFATNPNLSLTAMRMGVSIFFRQKDKIDCK